MRARGLRASREHFEAMLEDPAAVAHLRGAAGVSEVFEPHLYEVAFVDLAADHG